MILVAKTHSEKRQARTSHKYFGNFCQLEGLLLSSYLHEPVITFFFWVCLRSTLSLFSRTWKIITSYSRIFPLSPTWKAFEIWHFITLWASTVEPRVLTLCYPAFSWHCQVELYRLHWSDLFLLAPVWDCNGELLQSLEYGICQSARQACLGGL